MLISEGVLPDVCHRGWKIFTISRYLASLRHFDAFQC